MNLERHMSDEILSHCILSTINYKERMILELYKDKVRHILPEINLDRNHEYIEKADALSKAFIENELIKKYIHNKKCTIILFENPPYLNYSNIENQKKGSKNKLITNSYVYSKMKEEINDRYLLNEYSNLFIWSAFKFYLRQDTDSYIVFSPIKYFKTQHLVNKRFIKGFGFNRKHFYTNTNAFISCILWQNVNENIKEIDLECFDIINNSLFNVGNIRVKKCFNRLSDRFYTKSLPKQKKGLYSELNGIERINKKSRVRSVDNDENIAYMVSNQFGFDNARLNTTLTRFARYDGNGTYISIYNFLEKLVAFSCGKYSDNIKNFTIVGQTMKTSDGYDKFIKDVKSGKLTNFLLKNLFWVCLTNQNHVLSIQGSDGKLYKNDLCLDENTIASIKIKELNFTKKENEIYLLWTEILKISKNLKNYNKEFTYGLYQIIRELLTKDNKLLNDKIKLLKKLLKEYYISELSPVFFEYEFLK